MDNNLDLNNENNHQNAPSGAQETPRPAEEIGEVKAAEPTAPAMSSEPAPMASEPSPAPFYGQVPPPPPPPYYWSYPPQTPPPAAPAPEHHGRRGLLVFAIVMSVCFALTLFLLLASFAAGGFFAWPDNVPDAAPSDDVTDRPSDHLPDVGTPDDDAPNGGAQGGVPGGHRPEDTTPDEPTAPEQPEVVYGDGELSIGDGKGEALSLQEISNAGNRVVVAISITTRLGGASGTGIIMTEDGYIATNAHVVENAETVKVLLYDGREYAASVIGYSEIDDLAVIKIDEVDLPVATFGDSSAAQVGDRTVVIGHPAGLEFGWTSTFGYVSAINRDVKIRETDGTMIKKMTLLQTDAIVNSGNSGGPMFNDRGEVIGIITLKLAGNYEGMGFAIPSNGAVPLLEALMRTGTTDGVQSEVSSQRPQLGITGGSVEGGNWYVISGNYSRVLTEEQAAQTEGSFYVPASGVLVVSVATASDAYNKILEGDIITAINDTRLTTMDAMREYLYDLRVGDTVKITVYREGKEQSVSILLTPPTE